MNTITVVLVITLIGQSLVRADEPATQRSGPMVLSRAIVVEASRLASSDPSFMAGGRQTVSPLVPLTRGQGAYVTVPLVGRCSVT
jgi:hypothetical protein